MNAAKPKRYSHYAYLSHPDGGREPTGMFDLIMDGPKERRTLIHGLLRNGELLAELPDDKISDMKALQAALNSLFPPRQRGTDNPNNSPE